MPGSAAGSAAGSMVGSAVGSAVNLADISGSGHRRAHFTPEVLDSAHFRVRPGSAEELSGSGAQHADLALALTLPPTLALTPTLTLTLTLTLTPTPTLS